MFSFFFFLGLRFSKKSGAYVDVPALQGTQSVQDFLQCRSVEVNGSMTCVPSNPLLTPKGTLQFTLYQVREEMKMNIKNERLGVAQGCQMHIIITGHGVCMYACVCERTRAHVCMCLCVSVCARAHVCKCMYASMHVTLTRTIQLNVHTVEQVKPWCAEKTQSNP